MFKVENKTIYKAFELAILSEIPLPELPHSVFEVDSKIDIEITKRDLTKKWDEFSDKNSDFYIEKNCVMFKFWDIAVFSVQDGRSITVSPLNSFDEDIAALVILGTCMGAILIQRRILPLHGSAIEINGKAYAIVGDSGAGKSTLALAFLNKGYSLLTDDVIAVSSEGNIPIVTPSYPQQKLWKDCLESFGIDRGNYKSLFGRENKYTVPVSMYSTKSLPLGGIIELVKTEDEDITIRQIENLERFFKLFYHTYRNFFIHRLGLMSWHFDFCTKIINSTHLYQIHRPISRSSSSELVSELLNMLNKGE